MLTYTQFIAERTSDPVKLAQRASRLYGKRKSFGKWEKVEKGGHIPLTSFNSRKSEAVFDKEWGVNKKLGDEEFWNAHTAKTMKISDLHATQPFVRTNDVEKLAGKIAERNPSHVRVVTYRGIHYIDDGHHAVMAAKLRGETHIAVNYLDLDKYPTK